MEICNANAKDSPSTREGGGGGRRRYCCNDLDCAKEGKSFRTQSELYEHLRSKHCIAMSQSPLESVKVKKPSAEAIKLEIAKNKERALTKKK